MTPRLGQQTGCWAALALISAIVLVFGLSVDCKKFDSSKYNICGLVPKFQDKHRFVDNEVENQPELMIDELDDTENDFSPRSAHGTFGYIAGGFQAKVGQFPSYVSIRLALTSINSNFCGGVLVSDRVVLSAAHCFANADKNHVYVAPSIINPERWDSLNIKTYKADRVCSEPRYKHSAAGSGHDYAVVRLSEPVKLSENVQTVCFPGAPLPRDTEAFAVGLGFLNNSGIHPDIMQVLPVKQVECEEEDEHESHICFQASRKRYSGDTCSGDSGGPIYARVNGRMRLYGLTNYGPVNCQPGSNGISVNADVYRQMNPITRLIEKCMS